jgi:hypothetical protein
MAATKLKTPGAIQLIKSYSSKFATAATLASVIDASGTGDRDTLGPEGGSTAVPKKTTKFAVSCSGAVHWQLGSDPTSAIGHAVAADEVFYVSHSQMVQGAKIIADAGSGVTVLVALMTE